MFASSRIRTPSAVAAGRRRSASTADRRPVIVGAARAARASVLVVGIEDELARRAVDHDQLPGLDELAGVVQADDRRHVERSRQDGGVVRAAAGVGGEAADLGPVDLRRERRRQLVGDRAPTTRRARAADRAAWPRPAAGSSCSRPTRSATSPLRSRRYGSATSSNTALNSWNTCCTAHSALTRCSRTMSAARGTQHRIVEHQQLGVEERRQLGPRGRATRARMSTSCSRDRLAALVEPRELVLEPRRRDLIAQHLRALDQNDRPAATRRPATRRCRSGAAYVLAEAGLDQRGQRRRPRRARPRRRRVIVMVDAARRGQQQDAHDALAVHLAPIARHADAAPRYRVARWTNFAAARACMPS